MKAWGRDDSLRCLRKLRTAALRRLNRFPAHAPCPIRSRWIDGQGTDPYEQNTQQSPAFGFSSAPHDGHAKKKWHDSSGIVFTDTCPHWGHVSFETRLTTMCASGIARLLINPGTGLAT
jgi:hypothetical protein